MSAVGLTTEEAGRRLVASGPNELPREAKASALRIFARQFQGVMVWLLLGAAGLSAALREVADAVAIAVIVLVNAAVGFAQEHRAERAMDALRSMTAPRARVVRDGRVRSIAASDIVIGDVLALEAGDVVGADARVLEAHALSSNEAALTGESAPVEKSTAADPEGTALAERRGSVFLGTAIATGTGRAEVVATGATTELGKIAGLLSRTQAERTPLEIRLERVGRTLALLCVAVVAVVAVLGLARGEPWLEVLLASVSLAVAAVPESLAAIVTIALALGVQRMASRRALVRRLPAVEALGCATVICTDKTGTLTTGKMRVREVWGVDHDRVLAVAAACSDAELDEGREDGVGDPTEVAILLEAASRGVHRADIERERPRVETHPFDAGRKRMSVRRADGVLYVKGAPEVLFELSAASDLGDARAANVEMAKRGLRVLCVATAGGPEERDLAIVGLLGIADPPRTDAVDAIAAARAAGIRTVMITGDQQLTARAIAVELGIVRDGEPDDELVHARATPEDKLAIVRRWKDRGEIVAMTGDGVNDAPALREAHVGIAMGKSGTDVAREAAAIVLTDDAFSTIVEAIREGRGIFDNIQKTLVYLLSGNLAELAFVLGAAALGLPLPLTALQILWINLVTDSLPALALVMDPPDPGVLSRAPRRASEPFLGGRQWRSVALVALLEASVVLGVYVWTLSSRDLDEARNLAFSVLVFSEVLRAFAARSDTLSFFETDVLSNGKLLVVVALTVFVQLAIHHVPALESLFGIHPISLEDCVLSLGAGLVPVSVVEVIKLARRARPRKTRIA